uniref:Uncharacterized protein n=1 Tax=Ascaris lumbricoides TaxID=6252 RepID=A0A9J2P6M6_ASCLU
MGEKRHRWSRTSSHFPWQIVAVVDVADAADCWELVAVVELFAAVRSAVARRLHCLSHAFEAVPRHQRHPNRPSC